MGLIQQCVAYTARTLGGIPACMGRNACFERERGWRVQISRGKGKTIINFPSLTDESAVSMHETRVFVVNQKPYTAMLRILAEPPVEKKQEKVERGAFARKG